MGNASGDAPINAVVVGYGYAGQRIHVPLVQLEQGLRLHGVCSGDPAKRQAVISQLGCAVYTSLAEVLADPAVDLVILATPNSLHADQTIAAMSAGKHVVVDKPMCLNLAEADRMIDCCRRTGRVLRVFQNRRLDGDFLTIRSLLRSGILGTVSWMELSWQKYGLPRTWRRSTDTGGGRLYDLGSHLIDQALLLNSSPLRSVFCRQAYEFEGYDIPSHSMLTLLFGDGSTAVIDTTSASHLPKPRYVLLGKQATFVKYGVDPQEAALAAGDLDSAREDPSLYGQLDDGQMRRTVPTESGRWRDYYREVTCAIAGSQGSDVSDLALVRTQIAVLEAAARSAAIGQVVPLPKDD